VTDEKIIRAGGVDLCAQTFGSPADPAILLIQGMGGSMLWWEEEFCTRLAAGPRFVIRYDHRDTGRSVHYPPGVPAYTGRDLTDDALGVLDAFGVSAAHVVGISMGGGIAQEIGMRHPSRVASLTLISTTAGGDNLPGMTPRMVEYLRTAGEPDWSDRAAVIDYLVEAFRAYAGTLPFDEVHIRALAAQDVDRTADIHASQINHALLPDDGEPWQDRLSSLRIPTLVCHGTEDPLFPYPHGEALADLIPGARLVPMEGAGHELPRPVWDTVIPAILEHTSTA
jgi:pimeloyl-ACP methyl ester carboxylesterase